ncbi:amino acid transporter [Kockovaella imperatae]|uniref:Amino acid transporter n=1 Tax=Kockovaella imperatae TaxID=4999 RepID=A0A1Y1USD7_9TREE|nr:amino acid transporter [Kockovaella imperatae]ORX40940.1 amino acid transporter [Kockovaella imperatae]
MAKDDIKNYNGDVTTYVGAPEGNYPPQFEGTHHDGDVEKADAIGARDGRILVDGAIDENDGAVHRVLKARHMAMIAIGGAIGTGLFVGSGESLATAGPVGVWLGYILMSTIVYSMAVALGEMAALFPVAGAFTHYGARFVDPALGFAQGINYWYSYAITLPTELSAAAIVITYWDEGFKHVPAAGYVTIMLVPVWLINLWGARAYGEAEFWFSTIKVITIIGLIILGIVLMCGGGPTHDPIGFRYWRNPGPFNNIAIETVTQPNNPGFIPGNWGKFLAFWNVFVQAAFSFIGTEIIATTLGEAQNPRRTVPRAIKTVFFRLALFYVGGIFVISVLVPYTDPRLLSGDGNAKASPFVIAIVNAKIKVLPSIVNAVLLISAWSAGNSDLYAASRTLYALSLQGQFPKVFRKCTKRGLPIWCVALTGAFGGLGYMGTGGTSVVTAFNWLYNLSATTGVITWWAILVSYLRFYYGLRKQGYSREAFPYRAPLQPWLSWYGVVFFALILIFNGFTVFLKGNWSVSNFFAAYVTLMIFAVCYFGWKVVKRTKIVPLEDIDFTTGRREIDEMEERDAEQFAQQEKWWQKLGAYVF